MISRDQQSKLESFKHLFLTLTNDDVYSHADQQKLYLFCQRLGLDWNEARRYVRDAACAFLVRVLGGKLSTRLSDAECLELARWQRRLALSVDDIDQVLASVLPHAVAPAGQPKQRAQRLTTAMLRSDIAKLPTQKL